MEGLHTSKVSQSLEDDQKTEVQSMISTLPKGNGWFSSKDIFLYQYQGFWYRSSVIEKLLIDSKSCYWKFFPSDILICSNAKSGSTWLKALAFAVATRKQYTKPKDNPLLTSLPHDLMPCIEFFHSAQQTRNPDLPLFATHLPYTSLPKSALDSDCKCVYICRDPKDLFVSRWHFLNKLKPDKDTDQIPLNETFDLFCRGISSFGPYWDHVITYLKARLDRPDKVLFLKYEDMMKDPNSNVVSLAEFMGFPFTNEEEMDGVPSMIVNMCSFESLSGLEINKTGKKTSLIGSVLHNSSFSRKAKVGDWKNYLTQEMADRIDQITKEKLSPFGLCL